MFKKSSKHIWKIFRKMNSADVNVEMIDFFRKLMHFFQFFFHEEVFLILIKHWKKKSKQKSKKKMFSSKLKIREFFHYSLKTSKNYRRFLFFFFVDTKKTRFSDNEISSFSNSEFENVIVFLLFFFFFEFASLSFRMLIEKSSSLSRSEIESTKT